MKKIIRKEMIKKRMQLTRTELIEKSQLITEHLIGLNLLKENMNVFLYMDFRNEVMTQFILAYLKEINAHIILPKTHINDHSMTLHHIQDMEKLQLTKYGILEPTNETEIDVSQIDLILIPGVAFDKNGYRLGYGGGFYDRLLPHFKEKPVIALAFDLQVIKVVPREAHDRKVSMLLTESTIIDFNEN